MESIQERAAFTMNGFTAFIIMGIIAFLIWSTSRVLLSPLAVAFFFLSSGFTVLEPNEAKVLTFLGKYMGTIKESGFLFTIPFTFKKTVPLKLFNLVSDQIKVNDLHGNPIEIGAVVVWRIADAARAILNIDDYRIFVINQSDIAIRTLAAHYPYDSETETSLRGNIDEIAANLKKVLQEKLAVAGIIVEETKLSHLAYAPEIAAAMLKRQQAVAVLQARQYMVSNTLSIIDDVIGHFEKQKYNISDDKKADLINSLLIVMTSDKESTPVLNLDK